MKSKRYKNKLVLLSILVSLCTGCSNEYNSSVLNGSNVNRNTKPRTLFEQWDKTPLSYDELKMVEYRNYDYISDFVFNTKGGQRYRYVSTSDDDKYAFGWLNVRTLEEDVPCGKYRLITNTVPNGLKVFAQTQYAVTYGGNLDKITFDENGINIETVATNRFYDYISDDEFEAADGVMHRNVSVDNDQNYVYGWLNLETFNEDVPCKKYDSMGDYFTPGNGNVYKEVSVLDDDKYASGWLNMLTYEEDIPCKTYIEIDKTSDPEYYLGVTNFGIKKKILSKKFE